MAGDQAFFDAYDGIEIELPNGKTLRRPALTLRESVHFLKALMAAQAGNAASFFEIVEKFPAAIDAEKELDDLTPAEVFDVASRFLLHRRTPPSRSPAATETERSSTPDGTT